jgi:hypothetical protein
MDRAKTLKGAAFTVWASAVAAVAVALFFQERFFAVQSVPVASLERSTGLVSWRPDGLMRWHDALDGQHLFDGDRIATGSGAGARIAFADGPALELGAETQIRIAAGQRGKDDEVFAVTLLRGTVAAAPVAKCKDCNKQIAIKAGTSTYFAGKDKSVGVKREAGQKAERIDVAQVHKAVKAAEAAPAAVRAPAFAVLDAVYLKPAPALAPPAPVPTPTPKPAPPKPEARPRVALAARGFEIALAEPPQGRTLWTTKPLAALSGTELEIPWTPPAEKPASGQWSPVVELSAGKGAHAVIDVTANGSKSARLAIAAARRVATVERGQGYSELGFTVRGGARVVDGEARNESFAGPGISYRIRSFGDTSGGALGIGLDALKADGGASTWFSPKAPVAVGGAPIAVLLASDRDLPRLLPYVRGAGAVGTARTGPGDGEGVYVVRSGQVVAELRGAGVTAGVRDQLLTALGGSFIFKGRRGALDAQRGNVKERVDALLSGGSVLYILRRNKLFPVNRDFVKTSAEVAQFVDSQAQAIFLEKVEILEVR